MKGTNTRTGCGLIRPGSSHCPFSERCEQTASESRGMMVCKTDASVKNFGLLALPLANSMEVLGTRASKH